MEIIEKAFNCPQCNCVLQKPVTLTCGASVCREHVENLSNNLFLCKSCEHDHQIVKESTNVNKALELLISANIKSIDLGDEFNGAFESCNELDRIIHDLEIITKDPNYFINNSIEKLRNKTELLREQHKLMIDEKANNIILELDMYEKECQANLDVDDFKIKIDAMSKNINQLKEQLAGCNKTLNDFSSKKNQFSNIWQESKTTIDKFTIESIHLKRELLVNKIDQYFSILDDFKEMTVKFNTKYKNNFDT